MASTETTAGETTTGTEAEGGHGGHGAFPPLDATHFPSQLLWLAISFGLLYYLMSRVVLPRLQAGLDARSHRIRGDISEANRLKEQSEKAAQAYEAALAEARAKAHAIAQDSRQSVMAELDAERAKVEAEIEERIAKAEASVRDMKSRALGEVEKIAVDVTSDIVERLVGSAPDAETVRRAVKTATGG